MGVNPGLWAAINASITHRKRVNNVDEKTINQGSSWVPSYESEPIDYFLISSPKNILENIRSVLEQEDNKDIDAISLYDLVLLMRKKYDELNSLRWKLKYNIGELVDLNKLYLNVDFDYDREQLVISYYNDKMYFKKVDGDLVIVKSACYHATNILGQCGDKISECYDEFLEAKGFDNDFIRNIKSVNSNFFINSDEYNVTISEKYRYRSSFNLSAKIYNNKYSYDCNSDNIAKLCRNNEDEIFKRIFIKISDCPEWTQEKLHQVRNEQLKWEIRKQKVLSLVRKINPFKKNIDK